MTFDIVAVSSYDRRPFIILGEFGNNLVLLLTCWVEHADRQARGNGGQSTTDHMQAAQAAD